MKIEQSLSDLLDECRETDDYKEAIQELERIETEIEDKLNSK